MAFPIPVQRLRPTRATVAAVAGVAWALSFGAVRNFVWADLRQGMIDLRGLSRSTRALVWIGFTLLGAMLLALLFNDVWRAASPLVPMNASLATAGRGSMLPVALIPTTLFLVALAWSFALTGALHARRPIRLGVLGVYLLSGAGWVNSDTSLASYLIGAAGGRDLLPLLAGWALLAAVPLYFHLRRDAEARPAREFPVLLTLVSAVFLLAQAGHMESWRSMGMPVLMGMLEMNVAAMQGLVMPLLLLIGVDIAAFTHHASGWAAGIATGGTARGVPQAILLGAVAWRVSQVVGELLERVATDGVRSEALQYAGALGIPLLALGVWWAVTRVRAALPEDQPASAEGILEEAERYAVPLILAFIGVQLMGSALVLVAQALPITPLTAVVQSIATGLSGVLNRFVTTPWHLVINATALVLAVRMVRRGRRSLALYLGIFGAAHLWYEATHPGRPLAALGWRGGEPEDFWWTLSIAAITLAWVVRGRLTRERSVALLGLVTMTWLLRQTDLLDDPYSPLFFGYSGIGFLAFGILWDVLTAGSWANRETDGLPRVSRVLMYVGYVLLTVTVVNWALTSHDLSTVGQFTGDTAMVGLERFGKPILYGVIFLTLGSAFRSARETPAAARA
ncbi:MAG TPA: hypothetical protein VHG28_09615 [Longimicrobiaceae bacterium]|nr:hypothetical protein [Longimicrobiaceae bacterium]